MTWQDHDTQDHDTKPFIGGDWVAPAGREYLVTHSGVDKVSFTGSTAAGRPISWPADLVPAAASVCS